MKEDKAFVRHMRMLGCAHWQRPGSIYDASDPGPFLSMEKYSAVKKQIRVVESDMVMYGLKRTWIPWDSTEDDMLSKALERIIHREIDNRLCQWVCAETAPPRIYARIWRVVEWRSAPRGKLCSISSETFWDLVQQAYCPGHRAPGESDSCGLYAVTDSQVLYEYCHGVLSGSEVVRREEWDADVVLGLVEVWGKVVRAEHGVRAEYARPLVLIAMSQVLEKLEPKWLEVPQISVPKALEAIKHGFALREILNNFNVGSDKPLPFAIGRR